MARATKTPDPQTAAIFKRLDALAAQAPELTEPIAFYRAALPAMRASRIAVPVKLDAEAAQRKLASGLPLLIGEDLPLDLDAARDLFIRLCRIVEQVGAPGVPKPGGWRLFSRGQLDTAQLPSGDLRPLERARDGDGAAIRTAAAAAIRHAVERDALDLSTVFSALMAGDTRRMELAANGLQLDAALLQMLAQNSLKPALRAWAQGVQGRVDFDAWRRGQCPVCSSPPALSEIQGKEGARRLRCAMCGSDWAYLRLKCAFCGNVDHNSLGYLSVEGEEEKYRVQTCDICRGYIKVVVTFDPTPVDLLPVEDLATLHLDRIAAERGYGRVPLP